MCAQGDDEDVVVGEGENVNMGGGEEEEEEDMEVEDEEEEEEEPVKVPDVVSSLNYPFGCELCMQCACSPVLIIFTEHLTKKISFPWAQ